MRFLHRTGRTAVDLAPQIIAPMLYAYETIPSALSSDQITAVLKSTRKDRIPDGIAGLCNLAALIDLRDARRRNHTAAARRHRLAGRHLAHPPFQNRRALAFAVDGAVGEALINYLRHGRPKTDVREIFIRTRAPYRPLTSLYNEVRRRLEAAGVKPHGKCGPHIFRHARAVSLLRASVPRKVIGDLLGHRSVEATIPYLKLATEDLRAIALEIPGQEARS